MTTRRRLKRGAASLPLLVAGTFVAPHVASASSSGTAALTAAEIAALSSGAATQHVIVQLRNQPDVGADKPHQAQRAAEVANASSGVVGELKAVHAAHLTTYKLLPAVAATVTPAEAKYLATRSDVAAVVPDTVVHLGSSAPAAAAAAGAVAAGHVNGTTSCSTNPAKPVQDEYLSTMHVGSSASEANTARGLGFDGTGVKVAFIADRVDPANPDFAPGHVSVVDFTGSGPTAPTFGGEAYIDSSGIAATGGVLHNVGGSGTNANPYGPLSPSTPCYVNVQGVAPGVTLLDLVAFGESNNAYNSVIAQAIDYATANGVQVLNESFGSNPFPDSGSADLTKQANDNATAAGTTVVVSSGDAGISGTEGSPATDPNVIGVGASTTYKTFGANGYGGAEFAKGYESDNISTISSSGSAPNGRSVDVVAPCELNWSTCTPDLSQFVECSNYFGNPTDIFPGGGTSQSAPVTSGTAALVIQAFEKAHDGAAPTPAEVKQLIVSSARDLGAPGDQQGAGEVYAYRAVIAA